MWSFSQEKIAFTKARELKIHETPKNMQMISLKFNICKKLLECCALNSPSKLNI